MAGSVAEGLRDIAKLETFLQEQKTSFAKAVGERSQLVSFAEHRAYQVYAREVLAKAASAFDAIEGLRTIIAKAIQLQDQADTKDTQIKAEGAPHGFTESSAL